MNTLTTLSRSALFAALLLSSSGLAAHAQNALTTVSNEGMSEATAARIGCGVGDSTFIYAVSRAGEANAFNWFSMPNMVGLLAGATVFAVSLALLPKESRDKCIGVIKGAAKVVVHFNTACMVGQTLFYGLNFLSIFTLPLMLFVSWKLSRNFRQEFVSTILHGALNKNAAVRNVSKRVEPVRTESVRVESVCVEPGSAEPVTAPALSSITVPVEPVFAEPLFAEPVFAEPVFAEPVFAEYELSEQQIAETVAMLNKQFATTESTDEAELVCLSR